MSIHSGGIAVCHSCGMTWCPAPIDSSKPLPCGCPSRSPGGCVEGLEALRRKAEREAEREALTRWEAELTDDELAEIEAIEAGWAEGAHHRLADR